MINFQFERVTERKAALFDPHLMREDVPDLLLHVGDFDTHASPDHDADVAHLTARFRIEGGLIQYDQPGFAGRERTDFRSGADERCDHAFGDFRLVTEEFRRAHAFAQGEPDGFGSCLA